MWGRRDQAGAAAHGDTLGAMRGSYVVIAIVVGACGSSGPTAKDDAHWDDTVARFVAATCDTPCETGDHAKCKSVVTGDLAQARDELDAAGGSREACLACLRVKTDVAPQVAANHCTPTP